jgi:outer membrane protein, multidrug efflux system
MNHTIRSICLLVLLGCSPRVTNIDPQVRSPETFARSGTVSLQDRWWLAFSDPKVDSLVTAALDSNFSLESTWHRLTAAKAAVDHEKASLFPALTGTVTGEIERGSGDSKSTRVGVASDYELDLWGKVRSSIDAERHRFRATRADYQTAALSLTAEVVRTWYQLMDARSRLDLFERQIETNTKVLGLIRARFGSGQVRSVDILRQKQLLESTREGKIGAQSRIAVLEHRLAILLGRPPQDAIKYGRRPLPNLPALPSTGLPAQLIQRRPDVQRAFSLLRAADRDLAVAITNRYPRLTLSASTSSTNTGGGFEEWARNLTSGLFAPIFNGGELGAEVRRRRALKDERLARYGQAILTAYQEVEDALSQEEKQTERIRSIEMQVELAGQTYDQLRLEYLNGISEYLDVLTALTAQQRLHRDLISARLVLLEHRISLYRALAGGFETHRERPSETETHQAG